MPLPDCDATTILTQGESDKDRAALQAFEDEVIDRLYVLNAERAREEERLGLRKKKDAKKARNKKAPERASRQADFGFDGDDESREGAR